jgi:hypothetical protein
MPNPTSSESLNSPGADTSNTGYRDVCSGYALRAHDTIQSCQATKSALNFSGHAARKLQTSETI